MRSRQKALADAGMRKMNKATIQAIQHNLHGSGRDSQTLPLAALRDRLRREVGAHRLKGKQTLKTLIMY